MTEPTGDGDDQTGAAGLSDAAPPDARPSDNVTAQPSDLVASLQRALSLANAAGSDKTAFLLELAIASEALRLDEERMDRH